MWKDRSAVAATMLSPSVDSYTLASGVPIQWSDQAVHIKDFSSKHSVPNIVKVTKGQYRNIGVSKSVCSELYLHSVNTISKVLAESVKMKEGKNKMIVSDQKYSLPVTYKGWFELLSQDGKAIKAIITVQELARFFPPSCLVRENIKGFIHHGNGELSLDRTRVVQAGEVLTLVGEIWVPFPMGKVMAKRRILKCIDLNGEDIFFGLEQKGTFSPIAGQNNISGVHNIKGLLDKFRLPLMVRLVHGVIPTKMEKGFTGVFRFVNIYSDENAFVCPLKKDSKMVPVSTRETLKVVACHNFQSLSLQEECRSVQRRCKEMLDSYMNSIHILVTMPDSSVLLKGKQELQHMDVEVNVSKDVKVESQSAAPAPAVPLMPSMSDVEEDLLFQEIDGIYQYVREGGVVQERWMRPSPVDLPSRKDSGGPPPKPLPLITDSMQTLPTDDPSMEIKMKQLDILDEDDEYEDEANQYRNTLPKHDGYNWMEPIYEPLDKIREQKKRLSIKKTGFDTPPDSVGPETKATTPDAINNNILQTSSSPPVPQPLSLQTSVSLSPGATQSQPMRKTSLELGTPVSNLRQVMKSGGYTETLRPVGFDPRAASETIEQVYNYLPPPIPPKRFEGNHHSTTEGVPKLSPGTVNFAIKNNIKGHPAAGQPGLTKQADMAGLGSAAYITSPDKFQHLPPHQSTPQASHPPYVAVAKVGDYQNRAAAPIGINNGMYRRGNGLEHSRAQKIHSMYL